MAVVTILLSCALAAIAASLRYAFFGASLGQAFLTYVMLSIVLSATVLGAAMLFAMLRTTRNAGSSPTGQDLETWQDWQTEEAIESDRLHFHADKALNGPAEFQRTDISPVMSPTSQVAVTAYSVQKAGRG